MVDLIDRLRAGSGADRELDLVIGHLWPTPRPFDLSVTQCRGMKPPVYPFTDDMIGIGYCIALAEKVMPGMDFTITRDAVINRVSFWTRGQPGGGLHVSAEGDDLCRAFLIALARNQLPALIARYERMIEALNDIAARSYGVSGLSSQAINKEFNDMALAALKESKNG